MLCPHNAPTADLHFLTRSFQLYVFLYFIESLLQSLFGYSIVKAVFCLSRDICVMSPPTPSRTEHYACHRRSLQALLLILLMLQFQLKTSCLTVLHTHYICITRGDFHYTIQHSRLRTESHPLLVEVWSLETYRYVLCKIKFSTTVKFRFKIKNAGSLKTYF